MNNKGLLFLAVFYAMIVAVENSFSSDFFLAMAALGAVAFVGSD